MIRALKTAATGMRAQQLNVDNIANNLANINTTGFKRSKVEFQDLFYQTARVPGRVAGQGIEAPSGLEVGYGTAPVATQRIFSPGEILPTNNPLDLAINGDGFFRISTPVLLNSSAPLPALHSSSSADTRSYMGSSPAESSSSSCFSS